MTEEIVARNNDSEVLPRYIRINGVLYEIQEWMVVSPFAGYKGEANVTRLQVLEDSEI